MLDVNYIRQNADKLKELVKIGRASSEHVDVDLWLKLDNQRKELLLKLDEVNRERNKLADRGKSGDIEGLKEEGRRLKEEGIKLNEELQEVNTKWQSILDWMPNIPLAEVPVGKGAEDNIEFKAWEPVNGYLPIEKLSAAEGSAKFMPKHATNSKEVFPVKPHWEIGKALDIIDLEAGAKVSGSRFYYIKKEGALLIMAVFNLLLKKLVQDGFDPMIVPVLVKERALYGSSQFPGDADQVYKLESKYLEDSNSQLYLIGSSEPSNFSYFADSVLEASQLPIKVMAQTPCFRSEVGSWGKDVRGIKRTHQFDKLEMNIIMEADLDKAREMHYYLLSLNEWLLQTLKLPYHVINMCTGDLGYFAAAKKYDVEVWLPCAGEYMEVMSDSITTDFQARRLNIRYKHKDGSQKFAYTLNDTGATHRLLIAIIEHYQTLEGKLNVPEALQDFVGKAVIG